MGRTSARLAEQKRREWVASLTGRPTVTPRIDAARGRGADYEEAPTPWVCNRKKAYPSKEIATKVSRRMNEGNTQRDEGDEFKDVIVAPYFCRRCGMYHVGR